MIEIATTTASTTSAFIQWMGLLLTAGFGVTLWFFRKGGIYNPHMPSLDRLPPEEPFIPASPPPVQAPVATKTTPPSPVPVKTGQSLIRFCEAIRDNEGGPNNINYKQNNPGNCRCSPVGYAPMYGNVRCVNNFSFFPTYALGWLYLQNLVHFRAMKHPTWTILDFFQDYAPSSDANDPHAYASFVAKRCGVSVDKQLKDLFA